MDATKDYLTKLMIQDPGLPQPHPTQAYWQSVPHALSIVQSPTLSEAVDVAIIGSGITGASVAKTILEQHPTVRVTVFEARTICSGATGRNGGQLAINAAETYVGLKETLGADMAGEIIRFNLETLDRLREVAHELGVVEHAELAEVFKLRSYKDATAWGRIRAGVDALRADHPSLAAMYRLLDPAACTKEYGVVGVVGGVVHPAGTIWPYRFVTKVFENLLDRFPSRIAIETSTPITGVQYDSSGDAEFPYLLQTSRGEVRAAQVSYCANAYTSHLLPSLRGVIYPLKGTMTVQDLGTEMPNHGSKRSWAIHYTPFEDDQEGSVADGLIYGMQNIHTGAFFFGGEKSSLASMISADDSELSLTSVKFLRESLLSLVGQDPKDIDKSKLISSWSGVMGFTSDGLPLVGHLPVSVTGRPGQGEWLCAGFNGYGMPTAWLAGEELGRLILGLSTNRLPETYVLSEERMRDRLSVEQSVAFLVKS